MAHKKGGGSVKNGRDSVSKRLGVKRFGGELVTAGTRHLRRQDLDRYEDRRRPIQLILRLLWRIRQRPT